MTAVDRLVDLLTRGFAVVWEGDRVLPAPKGLLVRVYERDEQ